MSAEGRIFLDFSIRKLAQFEDRIADCLGRLDEKAIWQRGHDTENSIGNLVLHLNGNARQWILSGVGQTTDTRNRDREFAAQGGIPNADLLARLRSTLAEVKSVLGSLPPERLTDVVRPQSYEVTVLEAVYHVVEHFAQHTGQIIFATKMITGDDLGYYRHLTHPDHSGLTP